MDRVHIFLGGTCGANNWRETFTSSLMGNGLSANAIFNPVVKDWNEEAQHREEAAKATARYLLFYIADPMDGVNQLSAYSMVEATMSLYDKPERTVVIFDTGSMSGHPLKAINQTRKVLATRFPQGNIFASPKEAIDWLATR